MTKEWPTWASQVITPEQSRMVVSLMLGELLGNGVDPTIIHMVCDYLRATLAPLVRVETEDAT